MALPWLIGLGAVALGTVVVKSLGDDDTSSKSNDYADDRKQQEQLLQEHLNREQQKLQSALIFQINETIIDGKQQLQNILQNHVQSDQISCNLLDRGFEHEKISLSGLVGVYKSNIDESLVSYSDTVSSYLEIYMKYIQNNVSHFYQLSEALSSIFFDELLEIKQFDKEIEALSQLIEKLDE